MNMSHSFCTCCLQALKVCPWTCARHTLYIVPVPDIFTILIWWIERFVANPAGGTGHIFCRKLLCVCSTGVQDEKYDVIRDIDNNNE